MKRYLQPITVDVQNQRPYTFLWQGQAYRVLSVLDQWKVRTLWWRQEEQRHYFQVLAAQEGPLPSGPGLPVPAEAQGVYELFCSCGAWFLARILD